MIAKVRALLARAWHSPVLMTWGSSAMRSLNLLLVLPLIVTRLDAPEITLWYLFTTLVQLQLLADFGFSPTFVRVFSYAVGGLRASELADQRRPSTPVGAAYNWETIDAIWGTVSTVYRRLTLAAVGGLLVIGTPFVYGPIMDTADPDRSFLAWGVILVASCVILRGNAYAAYLNGLDQVALVRRWEALMGVGAIATQAAVLLLGGGILELAIAHQGWLVLNVARNRFLARWIHDGRLKDFKSSSDPVVLAAVWPSAWRSGLGVAMGNLPLQLTGLFYAQVAPPVRSAEYLVSLNVIGAIRGFAMAPFYSRLPKMARLRAEARLQELALLARSGMGWSYWTFALLFVGTGFFGAEALDFVGANATLVPATLWAAFGAAMLLERYGAMHLHLYSTTNHVLWHVANGVAGLLILGAAALLFPVLDAMAFPLAILIAYATFYVPYIVPRSLASLALSWRRFDAPALAGPFLLVSAYAALVFLLG